MKHKTLTTPVISEFGQKVYQAMAQCNAPWDETYYWISKPSKHQLSRQHTYRHGRSLKFFPRKVGSDDLFEGVGTSTFDPLFDEVSKNEGYEPKVVVLIISRDGTSQLSYDMHNSSGLNVTFNAVGLKNGYFTREEIDPPDFVLEQLNTHARWEALLEGRPVLQLTFRESDFGEPGPVHIDAIEEAIDEELTSQDCARVICAQYWDKDGINYEGLTIGVVELEFAVKKLTAILKKLKVPAGVTLQMIKPESKSFDLGLQSREDLTREATEKYIEQLIAESIRCSPEEWRDGTLTINADSNHNIRYKLLNPTHHKRAQISEALKMLCEELVVVGWKNGSKWTEAVLMFEKGTDGVRFKANFSYEPITLPPPENVAATAVTSKPWWKFWN